MHPRRGLLFGTALFAAAQIVVIVGSQSTGPTFAELARIDAVRRVEPIVRSVASEGVHELLSPTAKVVFEDTAARGTLPALLSAWATLGPARAGLIDPLVAHRFGWLIVVALTPLALYWAARSALGDRAAGLSAVLLMTMPRWLHEASVGSEAAVVVAWWLILIGCYMRSFSGARASSRPQCWAVLGALALGGAASYDLAVLWILPLVLVHFAWTRRDGRLLASLRQGRLPVPSLVLYAIVLAPLAWLGTSPQFWRTSARGAVRSVLEPIGAAVEPTLFLGEEVVATPVPWSFPIVWLAGAVPILVTAFAIAGTVVMIRDYYRRKMEGGGEVDSLRFKTLIGLVLAVVVIGPGLVPDLLVLFPPRGLLALPFVAVLGAVGIDYLASSFERRWVRDGSAVLSVAICGALGARDLETASVAYSWNLGGTGRIVESQLLPSGDGSELAALARDIDDRGLGRVTIEAEGVPKNYFESLRKLDRLRTEVSIAKSGAALEIHQREESDAVASVVRDGATLWSLRER